MGLDWRENYLAILDDLESEKDAPADLLAGC